MDLGELWRARQFRRLLNLIEHLPPASYFWEEFSLDEDIAEWLPDTETLHSERRSQWTPERDAMANLYDLIGVLLAATVKGNGGKAFQPPSFPRPMSATQIVRDRRDAVNYRELVDRITPGR